ncbi:integrator complex subunit [Striga asiatica]|uniref:Integrator complex subunit n=1 Tax=Striga asiatica TaxID=4170 RepID=A0A5A7PQX7_STRAF|nr:integrator complex subunit [Striga asiatica]
MHPYPAAIRLSSTTAPGLGWVLPSSSWVPISYLDKIKQDYKKKMAYSVLCGLGLLEQLLSWPSGAARNQRRPRVRAAGSGGRWGDAEMRWPMGMSMRKRWPSGANACELIWQATFTPAEEPPLLQLDRRRRPPDSYDRRRQPSIRQCSERFELIGTCNSDDIVTSGTLLNDDEYLEENHRFLVPIFVISSVAEELMAFTNIIPEWLCKQLQDRTLHSFLSPLESTTWTCYSFAPEMVWAGDPNSLLVMEDGVDTSLAFLPFKPMAMKVLQSSFLSGLQLQKSRHLLHILQPKHVLYVFCLALDQFPNILKQHIMSSLETSFSVSYYHENETLHIPYTKHHGVGAWESRCRSHGGKNVNYQRR